MKCFNFIKGKILFYSQQKHPKTRTHPKLKTIDRKNPKLRKMKICIKKFLTIHVNKAI